MNFLSVCSGGLCSVVLEQQFLGKWLQIRSVIFAVFLVMMENAFRVLELWIRKIC